MKTVYIDENTGIFIHDDSLYYLHHERPNITLVKRSLTNGEEKILLSKNLSEQLLDVIWFDNKFYYTCNNNVYSYDLDSQEEKQILENATITDIDSDYIYVSDSMTEKRIISRKDASSQNISVHGTGTISSAGKKYISVTNSIGGNYLLDKNSNEKIPIQGIITSYYGNKIYANEDSLNSSDGISHIYEINCENLEKKEIFSGEDFSMGSISSDGKYMSLYQIGKGIRSSNILNLENHELIQCTIKQEED